MTIRTTTTARAASAAAVLLAALLAALLAPTTSYAVAPDAADAPQARAADARTRLTFTVDDCEGCEIQLTSARGWFDDQDSVRVWQSGTRAVENGSVTFPLATKRTWGLSVMVRAPWEGHTGYLTTVAWRYNGKHVGDPVTLEEAVTRTKASACWEGVRSREVTVPLVVERVRVRGVRKMVAGSIAFVPTTQSWLRPMRATVDGVLGSQDVNLCR